ncbi:hypothetical protein [Streptomyces lydicus]|uniref:hypothetical protein n=1 Tax=Streptomyces lydicus TaxID=47763 RepID=UPI00344518E1
MDLDAAYWVGKEALELGDGGVPRDRGDRHAVQRLDPLLQVGEDFVRRHTVDDSGRVLGDQVSRRLAHPAVLGPEHRVSPGPGALHSADESFVPLSRPATHDQSVLVQHPVQQSLLRRGVLLQLVHGIALLEVGVVAVELDDGDLAVCEGLLYSTTPGGFGAE